MNAYKITNTTDSLNKRHPNFNSTLSIDYVDQMSRKKLSLEPKKTIYFTANSLPLSLHRYRMKGLVSIVEITQQDILKFQKEDSSNKVIDEKPKKVVKSEKKVESKSSKSSNTNKNATNKKSYSRKTTTTTTEKEE